MWKRSFRARQPSESEGWRWENEAFVRDNPQKVKVEDVKTKLSCKISLKKWKLKMWKRSFRARQPSKSESWRCENEAFVQDNPQKLTLQDVKTKLSFETKVKIEDVKMKLSCKISLKNWHFKMWKRSFRARQPSKSESWRCENEALVRDILQKLTLQDVKNEAFVPDNPQKVKVEDVKTKL